MSFWGLCVGWNICVIKMLFQVDEFVVFFYECKRYGFYWVVMLFGNNDFNNIFIFGFFVIVVIMIKECDNICVLFDIF